MNRRVFLVACLVGLAIGLSSGPLVAGDPPLKVFLLVGQSNMQGHADVRTFEHLGMDAQTKPILDQLVDGNGQPRVCDDVWISYLSTNGEKIGRLTSGFGANESKIGPELTFGIFTQATLKEPILIIKAAWGGKSLNTDFRPPSAGPYVFTKAQLAAFEKQGKDVEAMLAEKKDATGRYYRLTIDHVKTVLADIGRIYPEYDAEDGYELSGMVWFQGWNDMVDSGTYPNRNQAGGYDQYSDVLAEFIRDLRQDLSAPDLPIVVGVLGVGGPVDAYSPSEARYKAVHQNFRSAMAKTANLDEFKANVSNVLTEQYWDSQLADLRSRSEAVGRDARKQVAAKKLTGSEISAANDAAMAAEFSEEELRTLQAGVSNFAFHYLGSATIQAKIGKGFAEALLKLMNE
jgi:alpha-galactosidase